MTDATQIDGDSAQMEDSLDQIDGVGDARERKLRQASIRNAGDLAEADAERLDTETDIPSHAVVKVVREARAHVGVEPPIEVSLDADSSGEAWPTPSGFADERVYGDGDSDSTETTTNDDDTTTNMSDNTQSTDSTVDDAGALADALSGVDEDDGSSEPEADEVDTVILMAGLGAFDDGECSDMGHEQRARHVQERIVESGVYPEKLVVPSDGIGASAIKSYANYAASEGIDIPPAQVFTAGGADEEVQYPGKDDYDKRDQRMLDEADGLVVLANGPLVGKFISEASDRNMFIDAPER